MCKNSVASVVLACELVLTIVGAPNACGGLLLDWNPSPGPAVAGYNLYYGLASRQYTSVVDVGTNAFTAPAGLSAGVTYYLAVKCYDTNGNESAFSNELTNTIAFPLTIVDQPSSQSGSAGSSLLIHVDVSGGAPITFQWFCGVMPVRGATNSVLILPSLVASMAGNYSVVVSNPWSAVTSAPAAITVTAPFAMPAPVAGDLGQPAPQIPAPPPEPLASVAGTYNGLFAPTNADGQPVVTEATAGFLENCVLTADGSYTAALDLGGSSYPLTGVLDQFGNGASTVSRAANGLADLTVVLHADLTFDTWQITGLVSSMDDSAPWTASLVADLATNVFLSVSNFVLLLPSNIPGAFGYAVGVNNSGVISLSGVLGDNSRFRQITPVSKDGNFPLYVNLYGNAGLLDGWIHLSNGIPGGTLTWIRPAGFGGRFSYGGGVTNVIDVVGAIDPQTSEQ